ncbi:putative G-protein pathway suppressor-containing protein [Homarus americanus]|uniref:Putative G-protein pathway suppressor-containing protein n=1 Tax=Homarus americanus TaxID=6706 RepID=A0A8J5N6D4_HOMAM|nr:putative G-protein pathway suppressor-containing protein [Homarus americanus]
MEQDLNDLKNQKHQLFQDLKVVLNEDATPKTCPAAKLSQGKMLFQSNLIPAEGLYPSMGTKFPAQPQPLVPQGSLKRTRTPSPQPPPQTGYQQIPYNFKNLQGHPPPSVSVTLPTTKAGGGAVCMRWSGTYYHGSNQAHGSSSQYQASSQAVAYLPPAAPTHTNPPAPPNPHNPSPR